MPEQILSDALDAATNLPFAPARGAEAIESLAKHFPQLYLQPIDPQESEEALAVHEETYRAATKRGLAPENATLEHFASNAADELRVVNTPAGPVAVLYLANRNAFETFLQCMGHRARAAAINPSIGAISYRGINDWARVRAANKAYLQAGGQSWAFDMLALAKKGAFKSELIVISEGPYSNVPADATPYSEEQWLDVSREIRLYHECAHIVCRRTMPENISPVWDEITADAAGLIMATGRYDEKLATTFLGVSTQGYIGGRLAEYLSDEQKADMDELAKQVYAAIVSLGQRAQEIRSSDAFDFLLEMKQAPLLAL